MADADPQPDQASATSSSAHSSPDFDRDIAPLLVRCTGCHGENQAQAGLRLDSLEGLFAGSRRQAVLIPGQSKQSLLIVMTAGSQPAMPRAGQPWSEAEQELVSRWIDEASPVLADQFMPHIRRAHWAYQPPVKSPLPPVRARHWPKNEIDHFVLSRLEAEKLAPSPPAEPAALIRRLALDLTGLPPTPDQVIAFEQNPSQAAYQKLVADLLASPHFGEHFARYWLDLARYSDTNGYSNDLARQNWKWRDWVIEAYNSNMPFDQFTLEQIAGDLLPDATLEQRIATGFHRNTMFNGEGGADPEEFRVEAVVDRVETTATVWLASTIGCARCHDHPHDPFSQREFYELFAYFNNTTDTGGGLLADPEPIMLLPTEDQQTQLSELESRILLLELKFGKASPGTPEAPQLFQAREELKTLKKQIEQTLVMIERETPRETFLLERGDFTRPGDRVICGTPQFLHASTLQQRQNRLGLAQWLVDKRNPLVARAEVNRIWTILFGRGLVSTPDDFGLLGEKPSHPELLDWLAVEFMESGWDRKQLITAIVGSSTYRQTANRTAELQERDPQNRLLARAARRRLDAETLRDCALAAAGLLSPEIGGPSVFPPQPDDFYADFNISYRNDLVWETSSGDQRYRRGLYTFWRRSALYPAFALLDAPSREKCSSQRERTNTPLQALVTLNDPVFVEAALALAARIQTQSGNTAAKMIYGFRLVAARAPLPEELLALEQLYNEELARLPGVTEKQQVAAEKRAWAVVANVLLNLDAALTKW